MTGPRSSGRTDAARHFCLRTGNGENGAAIGKHRILILDSQVPQGGPIGATARGVQQREEMARRLKEQKKMAESTPRVPPSYEQFKETPLRAEVHSGPQTLDFDLP